MPVKVAKRGNRYCAVDDGGKVDKCFRSRARCLAYVQAKNIGMLRQGKDPQAPPAPKMR